jgi:hypothetical protein
MHLVERSYFKCALRKASLTTVAALATLALTVDLASARGGARGGRVGVRAGGVTMHAGATSDQTGTRSPQQSRDPPAATQLSTGGVNLLTFIESTLPPAPPTAPAATSISAVAGPAAELPAVAPLSQPVAVTNFGRGGTATSLSPYYSSSAPTTEGGFATSPSLAAPSLPGGGGGTLEDCMHFWDRETHMSKVEWRAACQRSLHRLDDVTKELARKPIPPKPER